MCHIDIDTRDAHSLRMSPLSSDWKAQRRNDRRFARIIGDAVVSRLRDNIRRKKEEKRVGSSANTPGEISVFGYINGISEPTPR